MRQAALQKASIYFAAAFHQEAGDLILYPYA